MLKKTVLFFITVVWLTTAKAQKTDTLDALTDYDALFNEFENFIDSLLAPRSFALLNVGFCRGQFQYQRSSTLVEEVPKAIVTPSIAYYHKSGLGVNVVASIIHTKKFTPYQTAATASYDYVKNRNFLTGISFTHLFIRDSLPFYTSPLRHEAAAYFLYRDWWLKPAVAATFGWGSVTHVEQQREKLKLLKRKLPVITTTETTETIADISLTASVKHDFYWLNVFSKRDYVRITPQLVFTSGTQKYGLAQTNNSYVSEKRSGMAILYNTEKNYSTARSHFQPLSLSARIRTEFSKGVFFIQPQALFDYYFPEVEKKLIPSFVVNTGILF